MKYILLAVSLLVSFTSAAINVTFINPSVPGTAFWDRVTAVARAAADDLSINLTVLYGADNRIFNLDAVKKVTTSKVKPDYVIFSPYDGNAVQTYQALEQAKIPFITIERTLQPNEQVLLALPQEKYKYWLGEVFHDNIFAGKLLADSLIKHARQTNKDERLSIVGISGSFSGESNQRNEGLKSSVESHQDIQLLQIVPAIWSRERSRYIIHQLTGRFGKIDIAWTASDGMALGVLDSISSGSSEVNPDIVVGGIDWTVEAIEKVKSGELAASVGGHIMQTAWALVKIYDHHHGLKVFDKAANEKTFDLEVIDKENVDQYFVLANKVNWGLVDFLQFSRTVTKQPNYHFSISAMMADLNQPLATE